MASQNKNLRRAPRPHVQARHRVASSTRRNLVIVVASLVLSIVLGLLSHDLLLGSTILFTGLISAYYASIGRKFQYLPSIVNYALMGYAAYRNQLFGSASFSFLVCIPMQMLGFWAWSRHSQKSGQVKSRKFTAKLSIILVVSCIASSLAVGYLLSLIPSQRLSFLDAASNCINFCGLILMVMRYAEAWWVWMANNIVDLVIWTIIFFGGNSPEAPMMFATSIAYLAINIYGAVRWWRESHSAHA